MAVAVRDDEVGTEPGVCNVSRLLSKRPSFVPSLCSTNPLLVTHVVFPSLATAIGGAGQPEKKNISLYLECQEKECHIGSGNAVSMQPSLSFTRRARDGLLFEPRCFRHTLSTPVNALHKVASWRRATMARSDRKP